MKNLIYSTFTIVLLTVFSSCHTKRWAVRDTATMDVTKSGIYTKPKIADLRIDLNKSSGIATGDLHEKTIQAIKDEALQNVLRTNNADILIEPMYEVDGTGNIVNARVTGFPARISGFRDITTDDTLSFAVASKYFMRTANTSSSGVLNKALLTNDADADKKRRRTRIALGITLGLIIPAVIGGTLGGVLGGN